MNGNVTAHGPAAWVARRSCAGWALVAPSRQGANSLALASSDSAVLIAASALLAAREFALGDPGGRHVNVGIIRGRNVRFFRHRLEMLYFLLSHPRSVVADVRVLVQGRRGQKDPRKLGCGHPGDHGSS